MTRSGSLRLRLLLGAAILVALAVAAAGLALSVLFRNHLDRQYEAELVLQLDGLTAALEPAAAGPPSLRSLPADPRFAAAYGGRYWQVDLAGFAPLRSRSLWDQSLPLAEDGPAAGAIHHHALEVPGVGRLLVAERTVRFAGAPDRAIRVAVGMPAAEIATVARGFDRMLLATLSLLAAGLVAASAIQVAVGLAPLSRLSRALARVRTGAARRLEGRFPVEVEPMVDELNLLLGQQERSLERARGEAADLAHALKTPLQLLLLEADRAPPGDTARAGAIRAQAARMQGAIDRHLARARRRGRAAARGPGVEAAACAQGLLRVLAPLAAARGVTLDGTLAPGLHVAADRADLEEILGNLLDNACKWARSAVSLAGAVDQGMVRLSVEDDGPGLDAAELDRAFARGRRLDESVPGSGLGLAIARDTAEAAGGWITLARSSLGGLAATVHLPRG